MVVVVGILKKTGMQFFVLNVNTAIGGMFIQLSLFFGLTAPSFTLNMGYIADPAHSAQLEICWFNSVFPLMHDGVFSKTSAFFVHSCILCNLCAAGQEQ